MPPIASRTSVRTRPLARSVLPNLPVDLSLPGFELQMPSYNTDYFSLEIMHKQAADIKILKSLMEYSC